MVNRQTRGYAIVEVLISIVVLTTLAVGVVASDQGGARALRHGLEDTAAQALLQDRLERARATPGALAIGSRTTPWSDAAPTLRDAELTETVRLREAGLLELEVQLRWTRAAGAPTERHLVTWIAREDGR